MAQDQPSQHGADFNGADFNGADFNGADFNGAAVLIAAAGFRP